MYPHQALSIFQYFEAWINSSVHIYVCHVVRTVRGTNFHFHLLIISDICIEMVFYVGKEINFQHLCFKHLPSTISVHHVIKLFYVFETATYVKSQRISLSTNTHSHLCHTTFLKFKWKNAFIEGKTMWTIHAPLSRDCNMLAFYYLRIYIVNIINCWRNNAWKHSKCVMQTHFAHYEQQEREEEGEGAKSKEGEWRNIAWCCINGQIPLMHFKMFECFVHSSYA